MLVKSSEEPQILFKQFVSNWFELISIGQWEEAFSQIDLSPNFGVSYTPRIFRNEIENEHFGEGTLFRKENSNIVYSNPKEIEGNGNPVIYPLEGTNGYSFEYDVALNNQFSDLTSGWEFIDSGTYYKVKLDFLNVL